MSAAGRGLSLPRASVGVLPVSVFRDARVVYVLRRLGEASDEFFDAALLQLAEVMPRAPLPEQTRAMAAALARTVPQWSPAIIKQRVDRILDLARDFEAAVHATFAIYVKDAYAEDLRGRRRRVQICMPRLGDFVHAFFSRIVVSPEVRRGSYFDTASTAARNFAVSNAMLDALADMCVDNVRVSGVESAAAPPAPAPPPVAAPAPAFSARPDPDPGSLDDDTEEDEDEDEDEDETEQEEDAREQQPPRPPFQPAPPAGIPVSAAFAAIAASAPPAPPLRAGGVPAAGQGSGAATARFATFLPPPTMPVAGGGGGTAAAAAAAGAAPAPAAAMPAAPPSPSSSSYVSQGSRRASSRRPSRTQSKGAMALIRKLRKMEG